MNTSNIVKIDEYIEKNIEKKINQLLDVLPSNNKNNNPKMIYEYTIGELYTGTIKTIVDIINELTNLNQERKYIDSKDYYKKIFDIFLHKDRKIFVGIFLVLLSFIIYFIDGADI